MNPSVLTPSPDAGGSDTAPFIRIEQLTKRYGQLTAVDHLDLTIPKGMCFGLLGPNGAGKTTLVEIIEDIISPSSGNVLYKGAVRSADFREEVGIMFQQTALLAFLSVKETLTTFQKLYQHTQNVDDLMALCHLTEIQDQLNDKISGGQRQRLLMALALINRPELLFLDEPSTGLDPQARRNLWDIIKTVKQEGKTIILTTHYMEEAENLCDRVAIMDRGKIIAIGTPPELIEKFGQGVTLLLNRQQNRGIEKDLPFDVTMEKDGIRIQTEDLNHCVQTLLAKGFNLTDMTVRRPNLETVFLHLTGRRLRD